MSMKKIPVLPRILRAYQAPGYLGMCRDVFNKTVRPYVREFPIGQQGIGFDRIELDQWTDAYIAAHSVDKRQPADPPARQTDEALQPKRKERSSAITGLISKAIDPHAKSKEEFQRVLAMVTGKPRPKSGHRSSTTEAKEQQTPEE